MREAVVAGGAGGARPSGRSRELRCRPCRGRSSRSRRSRGDGPPLPDEVGEQQAAVLRAEPEAAAQPREARSVESAGRARPGRSCRGRSGCRGRPPGRRRRCPACRWSATSGSSRRRRPSRPSAVPVPPREGRLRSLLKRIREPSGDQRGSASSPSLSVSRRCAGAVGRGGVDLAREPALVRAADRPVAVAHAGEREPRAVGRPRRRLRVADQQPRRARRRPGSSGSRGGSRSVVGVDARVGVRDRRRRRATSPARPTDVPPRNRLTATARAPPRSQVVDDDRRPVAVAVHGETARTSARAVGRPRRRRHVNAVAQRRERLPPSSTSRFGSPSRLTIREPRPVGRPRRLRAAANSTPPLASVGACRPDPPSLDEGDLGVLGRGVPRAEQRDQEECDMPHSSRLPALGGRDVVVGREHVVGVVRGLDLAQPLVVALRVRVRRARRVAEEVQQ